MFVKVTFKQNSVLFKNGLEDLESLSKAFKQLAKLDDGIPITFIFSD